MNRAERLFRLVELLRGRRLAVTAQTLAEVLEVSPRTIYRDIGALAASGAPIEGEAGIGYRMDRGYHMPPLMFDKDEVQALLTGLRLTRAFTDDELAYAAGRAEEKLRAVLDDDGLQRADRSPYEAPAYEWAIDLRALHLKVRKACEGCRKIKIGYRDEKGKTSTRIIHPFLLLRWQAVWTLIAWCELRQDDRHFRIDRISDAEVLDETFDAPTAGFREKLRMRLKEQPTTQ